MDGDAKLDAETYRMAAKLRRIGNRVVREAQAENRRLGIPNAYSRRWGVLSRSRRHRPASDLSS